LFLISLCSGNWPSIFFSPARRFISFPSYNETPTFHTRRISNGTALKRCRYSLSSTLLLPTHLASFALESFQLFSRSKNYTYAIGTLLRSHSSRVRDIRYFAFPETALRLKFAYISSGVLEAASSTTVFESLVPRVDSSPSPS
ncbi:hypothetical protein LINPERPRIM_LOCUS43249, partial [Linum perenne]